MYINFKKLHRSGITLEQLFLMCTVQQREPQEILDMYYNEAVPVTSFNELSCKSFIEILEHERK